MHPSAYINIYNIYNIYNKYIYTYFTSIVTITHPMNSQLQAYLTNLQHFYLTVIHRHPKSIQLANSFHNMIAHFTTHNPHTLSVTHAHSNYQQYQLYHNQNKYLMSKHGSRNSTNNSNKNRQENSESMKNKRGLSRMLSINNMDKLNNYYGIYSNQHFAATFIFGYIYTIIKDENQQILKMISTKINLLSQYQLNNNINTVTLKQQKTKLQNYLSDWKKIIQAVQHKGTINWQRILCSTFIGFDQKFISIIARSVLSLNSKTKIQLNQNIQIIRVISNQLKISTNLAYFQGEQVKDKKIIGGHKNTIIIGVHPRQKSILYAFYQKLPGDAYEPQPTSTRVLKKKGTLNTYDKQQKDSAKSKQSKDAYIKTRISSIKKQLKSQKSLKEVQSAVKLKKLKSLQNIQSPIKTTKAPQYKLIKRKTLMTVQVLLKQYQLSTAKLENLQCFDQSPFTDIQEKNEIQISRSQRIKKKQ